MLTYRTSVKPASNRVLAQQQALGCLLTLGMQSWLTLLLKLQIHSSAVSDKFHHKPF